MSKQTINSGSAPILWSTVDEAFDKINANFTELYLTIGGGELVDLSLLNSNVSPSVNGTYDLGSQSKQWRGLFVGEITIGSALITSQYGTIDLPAGSSIGGNILDSEYFKTIAVAGQTSIVADTGGEDTLTVASGNGIALTTNASTDTLTITNSGVISASGGTGISVNSGTGNVVITNSGVVSTIAGYGISVSSGTGNVTIANTGIVSVITDPGSGISLDTSVAGTVRITNSAPNIVQNTFRTISVSGQSDIIADTGTDTLTLIAGSGITLTTNATADAITISNNSSSAYQLVNGSYDFTLLGSGALALGGGFYTNRSASTGIECLPSVDTVVYTSISDASTIKVLVQFEGPEDGGDGNYHTHSCDIIAVKRTGPLGTVIVDATVYGGIYTSSAAIATFDARWNAIDSTIEITARPVSITNGGWVKLYATEIEFGGAP